MVYIVTCTDESQEPCYEDELAQVHAVYHIRQDADGDWICDYQDIR